MSEKRQAHSKPKSWQVRTFRVVYPDRYRTEDHAHGHDQLIYATGGVLDVHSGERRWVVPSHRAVWMPAGLSHTVEMVGRVSMRTLYFPSGMVTAPPARGSVVSVSPLLRELIVHATRETHLDGAIPEHARLVGVILDQLAVVPTTPVELPMPRDVRARRVVALLEAEPGSSLGSEALAHVGGMSVRTLERLFRHEVGMSFGRWRRQLRLLHALRLLASGEPVTEVALSVGYDSTSAFISMFKRHLGATPGRYHEAGSGPPE